MSHSPGVVDSEAIELSIGGLRIAARATGSGDPVLLLNGMRSIACNTQDRGSTRVAHRCGTEGGSGSASTARMRRY